jgi:RNA ligase (TIGR02306 family)
MSDWQPQIVRIEKVEKHPFADALDIATVLGDYPVIVKRDEYNTDDVAGYIPIDSIVPDTEYFHFLGPKITEKYEEIEGNEIVTKTRAIGPKFSVGSVPEKYRIIKAKKIRGIYSQGMLVKLPAFCGFKHETLTDGTDQHTGNSSPLDVLETLKVGDSIVDLVGLKKWEEEEEENLPGLKKTRGTNAEKAPQGWTIPHYDIDGIRKYIVCLNEGEEIVLTEKIHGSNAGFSHDGTRLWVKSRNFYKKQDEEDMWWDVALRYDLEYKLKQAATGLVFFGEVYGQVKGFRYDTIIAEGRLMTKVRFFDVWDTKLMRYMNYQERLNMLAACGLDSVPELYRGPWLGKEKMYPYAEGMSTLNPKHIREGWVLNTLTERYEPRLDSRMQVKLVGEGYNLQK